MKLSDVNYYFVFPEDFTIFAEVTQSANGFPKILYDNYAYGRKTTNYIWRKANKCDQAVSYWACTGSDLKTKKRCLASIMTRVIDGYTMMRFKNPNHLCTKKL